MSIKATKAVRARTQFIEDRQFGAFRILLALAEFADKDGMVGVPGNHKACPSFATLAREARVHINTVGNVMPLLVESGEVVIEAQGGNGRGRWTVYRLTQVADFDVVISEVIPQRPQEYGDQNSDVGISEIMPQWAQLLSQQIELLTQQIALLPQANTTNATTASHTRVDPIIDPIIDPGDPIIDPDNAGDDANGTEARFEALWPITTALVADWQREIGIYSDLEPDNAQHKADYFAPALRLVHEFDGNGRLAWQAVMDARNGMLRRGLTPKRLEPVVAQVLADMARAALPPLEPVASNGVAPKAHQNGKVAANMAAIDEVFANV